MGNKINPNVDHSEDLSQNELNLPLDGDIGQPSQSNGDGKGVSPLMTEDPPALDNETEENGEPEDDASDAGSADGKKLAQGEEENPVGDEDFQDLPQEQVNKLNPREKAFYRDLKKERERRKKVENERDFILLQKKFGPSADKQKVNAEEEETPEVWQDPFAGKDPDDVITLKELQAREQSRQAFEERRREKESARQKRKQDAQAIKAAEDAARIQAMEASFREDHPDYDEALKLAGEVIKKRPSLAFSIRAEMDDPAGDPISAVYDLAKQHPDYLARTRGKKESKDNVSRILRNATKPRTIANMNEQGGAADDLDAMDAEDLGKTLAGFSESQLSKVPRKLREKALRGY